jgi:carboxylate-amine ligase
VARPEELEIVPEPRYVDFVKYAGMTARRQGVSGLHVHVGMPDAASCYQALEGILPWLPAVLALSANSPYLAGSETGMRSTRAEILALLPRRGAPPPFGSYADWQRYVDRLVETGLVRDYTAIWWDVRPHPRFGTLEIRIPDQPTALARSAAFVALLQGLCAGVLNGRPRTADAAGRGIYDQNRWAAARFGPRGKLIHPDRAEALPAYELAAEAVELAAPAAAELGGEALLGLLDPARCEADEQLELGRERGIRAVCADLVKRSLASA